MIVRRFFIAVTAATLVVGSCGGDPPPPPPAPPGPDMDSLRAYQDSVRAAEEEARRLAAEEAARRAEEAERERARQRASRTLQQMVFFDYDMSDIRALCAAGDRRFTQAYIIHPISWGACSESSESAAPLPLLCHKPGIGRRLQSSGRRVFITMHGTLET